VEMSEAKTATDAGREITKRSHQVLCFQWQHEKRVFTSADCFFCDLVLDSIRHRGRRRLRVYCFLLFVRLLSCATLAHARANVCGSGSVSALRQPGCSQCGPHSHCLGCLSETAYQAPSLCNLIAPPRQTESRPCFDRNEGLNRDSMLNAPSAEQRVPQVSSRHDAGEACSRRTHNTVRV